jgi:hypothetical protein
MFQTPWLYGVPRAFTQVLRLVMDICGTIYRLGHLYDAMLQAPSNKIPFVFSCNFNSPKCTICSLAKFNKLHFSSHNSFSLHSFELIHRDLWALMKKLPMIINLTFMTIVDI